MRNSERQVTDIDEIAAFLEKCDTVRIGVFDREYPYVVPVSFGFEIQDGKIAIYFHGAKDGKKQRLFASNNKVCVEADAMNGYARLKHGITADYQSVIGFGRVERCEGDEAVKGLDLLMKHCGFEGFRDGSCGFIDATNVSKVIPEFLTCKKRFVSKVDRQAADNEK